MEYPLVHGGTSVSKYQSSHFIITFDELNHPSFQTYLTIYLFVYLLVFPPAPPPPCDVKSIRRCLSWPPDNIAHLVKKH